MGIRSSPLKLNSVTVLNFQIVRAEIVLDRGVGLDDVASFSSDDNVVEGLVLWDLGGSG